MRRRDWIGAIGATGLLKGAPPAAQLGCGCAFSPQEVVGSPGAPPGSKAFKDTGSKVRIAGIRSSVSLSTRRSRARTGRTFL